MKCALSTVLIACLALGACGSDQSQSRASSAQQAACRQRADEVYLRQNRADIYLADRYATSTRDAPFGGLPASNPSTGLSARYARENMVSNCLDGLSNARAPAVPIPAKP